MLHLGLYHVRENKDNYRLTAVRRGLVTLFFFMLIKLIRSLMRIYQCFLFLLF